MKLFLPLVVVICPSILTVLHGSCSAGEPNVWQSVQLDLVPTPRQCLATGREFRLGREATVAVIVGSDTPILRTASETVVGFLRRKGLRRVEAVRAGSLTDAELTIHLDSPQAEGRAEDARWRDGVARLATSVGAIHESPLQPQSYSLRTLEKGSTPQRLVAAVHGGDDVGTLYGAHTFLKTLRVTAEGLVVKELLVGDEPALEVRGFSPQWAWYLGNRAPYGETMWGLDRWKLALDFMAEYRLNMLALCTYGKFPFPLERHRSRCAVDLPFELWSPEKGLHTIRWTHPAYKDDFLGELVKYAHARGIRVLIYSCLNLQDEIGSRQWTNEDEITAYCDIQQQALKRYGVDGFIFESGEFFINHPEDLKRFGDDEWTRLKADVFLTRRYTDAIRAVKPDAIIGLVDHYLFKNWDERKVPQRVGLEPWKAELPPETLVAYVHSPDAYDVFPSERIWTYVFGPKGGLKPALQLHLADFCDVPRARKAAGAYYVTYDWIPHELDYLCFAESAWGHYGGGDRAGFVMHSSEGGVGGDISGRVWRNIKREFYGDGSEFGEGLITAGQGTFKGAWEMLPALRKGLERLIPALDAGDFAKAEKLVAEVEAQRAATEQGIAQMLAHRGRAAPGMVSEYPIQEHLDKAVLLCQAQLAWAEFVGKYYQTAIALARSPEDARNPFSSRKRVSSVMGDLQAAAVTAHARIRDCLSKAYFSYPHDKLGKFEFLASPDSLLADMAKLSVRFDLQAGADGKRLRLHNVAPQAAVTADSTFPSRYGPGYYEPRFAADSKEGTPGKGIWVSAETAGPHFLELSFTQPPTVRGIVVHWPRDATHDWIPQDFAVRICADKQPPTRQSFGDGAWTTVLDVKDNKEPVAVAKLEQPAKLAQVRILITRGCPSRPNLAAINEVEVLAVRE